MPYSKPKKSSMCILHRSAFLNLQSFNSNGISTWPTLIASSRPDDLQTGKANDLTCFQDAQILKLTTESCSKPIFIIRNCAIPRILNCRWANIDGFKSVYFQLLCTLTCIYFSFINNGALKCSHATPSKRLRLSQDLNSTCSNYCIYLMASGNLWNFVIILYITHYSETYMSFVWGDNIN